MIFFLWSYYYALWQFGSNWRHAQLLICRSINCKFGARISRLLSGVQNVQALFVIPEQRPLDMVNVMCKLGDFPAQNENYNADLLSWRALIDDDSAMLIDDSEVAQIHSCWVPLLCVNCVLPAAVGLICRCVGVVRGPDTGGRSLLLLCCSFYCNAVLGSCGRRCY